MASKPTLTDYYHISRHPSYGLLAVLPLALGYEVLALQLYDLQWTEIRNVADILIRQLMMMAGVRGHWLIAILVVATVLAFFLRDRDRFPFRIDYYFFIILESVVYGSLVGSIVGSMTDMLLMTPETGNDIGKHIMLSLGAGAYEELFFRAIMYHFTAYTIIHLLHREPMLGYVVAAVFSSLAFSLYHGLGSEPITFQQGTFYFLAGLFFCTVYQLRGLGVAAWTHALYDLFWVVTN